jgi:aryl-alcohol dehydrogenase-like predicted oxidoreductase
MRLSRLQATFSRHGTSRLKPVVSSVIAGATTPDQMKQNVDAVNWSLSSEELAEVDKLLS